MLQIHTLVPDAAFADQLWKSEAIAMTHQAIGSVRIAIRSADAAKNALHACEDRKMIEWGIDPVRWRALKERPAPIEEVRSRFRSLDYPSDALAAHAEEDAIVRLDVGVDGSVTKCSAVKPLTFRSFERAACRVMVGARFHPAQNADGTPVPAPYVYDVIFRIG